VRFLKSILRGVLSEGELSQVISSFDIIGDIAVLKIPPSLEGRKRDIAEAILENLKNVKVVYRQLSPVSGEYRITELEHLAGERRTSTLYKEHGCVLRVDVSKVFFTPRLSAERLRIASLVREGERVLNMFAGVGSFSIVIAKMKRTTLNYAVDINPDAYALIVENVRLNKLEGRVIPILGDSATVAESNLRDAVNRVLLPLPEKALQYVPHAVKALKPGEGYLHVYVHGPEARLEDLKEHYQDTLSSYIEREFKVDLVKKVREVGPKYNQYVIDVTVTKS